MSLNDSPSAPLRVRALASVLACALVLALVGLSGWLAYRLALRLGIAELQATGVHRVDLYAASLQREIDKYAFLPGTLGLSADVAELLTSPGDHAAVVRVNNYLEQLNVRAGTLSIYVLDTQGRVVAASNWRGLDSFVDEDLAFRPYFRDAMSGGNAHFFGIGTTRGTAGYYLAAALADDQNARGVRGVAVVKVSLEQLEKSWSTVEAPVLVADENGVVILSAVPAWKFTTLQRLDAQTRAAFHDSQQYNRRDLVPMDMRDIGGGSAAARRVHVGAHEPSTASMYAVSGRFLAQSRALPGTAWTITVLSQLGQVERLAYSRAGLAAIAAAALCLLGVIFAERRRHLRHRLAAREALQRAHDDLERKVQERTRDLLCANGRLQGEVAERLRAEATLREAQDELVQAGKLAVIGQLSTGIAHELNQPLAALRTLSANAARFLERGDAGTARANLARIAELVDRMGRITGQLRSFARKSGTPTGAPPPAPLAAVPLVHVLDNVQSLLEQRLLHSGATLTRRVEPAGLHVHCDAIRLEQVLTNLIGNALDAMAGQTPSRLDLSAWREGACVRLQVRDHGPGLSEQARAHLFEPFFTTKPAGEGLGLGLVISADIVRDFGGTLQAANHPDGGAVFTLDLPRATGHD